MKPTRAIGRAARWIGRGLWPDQRMIWTRELLGYGAIWVGLLAMGLFHQVNMILVIAGLAAGPIAASILTPGRLLKPLTPGRRLPRFAFEGGPLTIDYHLENGRKRTAALAMSVQDFLAPVDRAVSGWETRSPLAFFARIPRLGRGRLRWQGVAPHRGRYRLTNLEVVTRAPFGLLERRMTVPAPDEIVIYPRIGRLKRSWHKASREASQTRRGRRSDRSTQDQEYHGLRDYRPGDSPRWIHWRTTARLGVPMVKEFEQHSEQDLAILIDPWLPKNRPTAEQKDAVEAVVRFAATVCLDTCRRQGRRLLLGWTGETPGMAHGPASIRLLHELLENLATLRPNDDGRFARLLDAVPQSILRDASVLIVSTRPLRIADELRESERLHESAWRAFSHGRALILDASKGELDAYIQFEDRPTRTVDAGPIEPEVGDTP